MAKKKKYEPTNPNKKKEHKPVVHCPHCGSKDLVYMPDKRHVFSKWYVNVAALVAVIVFLFVQPVFGVAFGVVYVIFSLRKHKVLVGTCENCGEETLFNRPADGSLEPDFDQPWTS